LTRREGKAHPSNDGGIRCIVGREDRAAEGGYFVQNLFVGGLARDVDLAGESGQAVPDFDESKGSKADLFLAGPIRLRTAQKLRVD
jgi:hypothetical protein